MHTLPSLSDVERAHSARLTALIHDELQRAGGWLNFERFMELALYAPGLGYYSAGAHKFGSGGDFITAPEVSPLFGQCLATQCATVLQATHGGDVLELGAGSGAMAADVLLQLEQLHTLPTRYLILEVSAELRARQQALLQQRAPHLLHRICWLDALPERFHGMILANEVLDALPVQRFCIAEQGEVQAVGVAGDAQRLCWQLRPADAALCQAVHAIGDAIGQPLPTGFQSEINLRLQPWLTALAHCLEQGVMLFIDYGLPQAEYYHDERAQGTLACFFRHHIHDDPFINLGLQDITAWVDFTALATAGLTAGLELRGFATQAHFLLGAGLTQLIDRGVQTDDDAQRWRRSQQVQTLTLPSEMGERFKVMAFAKACDASLSGFAFRDLRDRL